MEINTNLAESIEKTSDQSRYDQESRYLVADKQVLSRIIKENVREFAGYSLDVIESCIEGEAQVSEVSLHPAGTKSQKIKGMSNESKIPNEKNITFDILHGIFSAFLH